MNSWPPFPTRALVRCGVRHASDPVYDVARITVGAVVGNLTHGIMGRRVHQLALAGSGPTGYDRPHTSLASMVLLARLAVRFLHALRRGVRTDAAGLTTSGRPDPPL